MTYQEALDFLHGLPAFSPARVAEGKAHYDLVAVRRLLERLGNPQNDLKYVHIAGTNGKGSTTAFLASILMEAGLVVGVYTSPFLERFNERIRVGEDEIADEDVARLMERVRAEYLAMEAAGERTPSEFEMLCAIAFLYFKERQCDIVLLEVGLGGRLDATNVIKTPELAVICTISFDHMQILGDTLPEIASEKAGIIKEGGEVLCYPKPDEVEEVFVEAAERAGAVLHFAGLPGSVEGVGRYFVDAAESDEDVKRYLTNATESAYRIGLFTKASGIVEDSEQYLVKKTESGKGIERFAEVSKCAEDAESGFITNLGKTEESKDHFSGSTSEAESKDAVSLEQTFDLVLPDDIPWVGDAAAVKDIHISLPGVYQKNNAALALQAACLLAKKGFSVSEQAIRRGLKKARWPGRFELLKRHPDFIIDGSHNEEGARALAESLGHYYYHCGKKIVFIVGILKDKSYEHMIKQILPLAKTFFCVSVPSPRTLPADELVETINRLWFEEEEVECSGADVRGTEASNVKGNVQEAVPLNANGNIRETSPPNVKGNIRETMSPNVEWNNQEVLLPNAKGNVQEALSPNAKSNARETLSPNAERNVREAATQPVKRNVRKVASRNDKGDAEWGAKATACTSIREAVDSAIREAGENGVVCAFGSLYYIGEVRRLVMKGEAS